MKVINEIRKGNITPAAGCVCNSGWKSTRGPWGPVWNCNCNCKPGETKNNNANFKRAKNA